MVIAFVEVNGETMSVWLGAGLALATSVRVMVDPSGIPAQDTRTR